MRAGGTADLWVVYVVDTHGKGAGGTHTECVSTIQTLTLQARVRLQHQHTHLQGNINRVIMYSYTHKHSIDTCYTDIHTYPHTYTYIHSIHNKCVLLTSMCRPTWYVPCVYKHVSAYLVCDLCV